MTAGEALDAREAVADAAAGAISDVNGYDLSNDELVSEQAALTDAELRELLYKVRHLDAALVYVQDNLPTVLKGMQDNPMLGMVLKGMGLGKD